MATEPPVVFKDLPDTTTPLNAATLNPAFQGAFVNATEAEAAAALAQQYAEQAAAPADDQIAALVQSETSATRASLDAQYAAVEDLAGKLPTPTVVSFTPVLTAATTNPTLGTGGTADGEYTRVGDWVQGWGIIIFGTGATPGAGAYFVSLPLPSAVTTGLPTVADVSYSNGMWMTGLGFPQTATTIALRVTGSSPAVSNTVPWAWAAGHQIRYRFSYRAVH